MSTTKHQTILTRAPARRMFHALTNREDIARWWGPVQPETANDPALWPGMDREWPITIAGRSQDHTLDLVLDLHHPTDRARVMPVRLHFSLDSHPDYTLVTVTTSGLEDEAWATMVNDGWAWVLYALQSWTESGRSFEERHDPAQFSTLTHEVTVAASPEWCWTALTDPGIMATWLDAAVRSTPEIGGSIDIRWHGGNHIGGEYVLLDAPRTLITHWWDAESLMKDDDPGLVTQMLWSIESMPEGFSRITMHDMGYPTATVDPAMLTAIDDGWKEMFDGIATLAEQENKR